VTDPGGREFECDARGHQDRGGPQLLEIPSRYELDGFLKRHGVPLEYTIEDFDREGATSARLWRKREQELAAEHERERQAE